MACVRDGDLIRIDAIAGTLHARVSAAEWSERVAVQASSASTPAAGIGNELFALFHNAVGSADSGASVFNYPAEEGARAVEPRTTSSGVNPRLRPTIC